MCLFERVFDKINNEPIPFAVISIDGTALITESDFDGNYNFKDIKKIISTVTISKISLKYALAKFYLIDLALKGCKDPVEEFLKKFKKNTDVIFNALHGRDGEDGVAQSYFEYLNMPPSIIKCQIFLNLPFFLRIID